MFFRGDKVREIETGTQGTICSALTPSLTWKVIWDGSKQESEVAEALLQPAHPSCFYPSSWELPVARSKNEELPENWHQILADERSDPEESGRHSRRVLKAETFVPLATRAWHLFDDSIWTPAPIPWTDMSDIERLSCWARVADHLLCTIGNGVEWNEKKGTPVLREVSVVPPFVTSEMPKFRFQHSWYPLSSEYSTILERDKFEPSFERLVWNVLESMVCFGIKGTCGSGGRFVDGHRQNMHRALARLRYFHELGSFTPLPHYLKDWVYQGDRADLWIDRFDLGPDLTEANIAAFEDQKRVSDNTKFIELNLPCTYNPYQHKPWDGISGDKCWYPDSHDSIPSYSVAKVLQNRIMNQTGCRLVEISFDYGSSWMKSDRRKAIPELVLFDYIREIPEEEYVSLLPKAKSRYRGKEI